MCWAKTSAPWLSTASAENAGSIMSTGNSGPETSSMRSIVASPTRNRGHGRNVDHADLDVRRNCCTEWRTDRAGPAQPNVMSG